MNARETILAAIAANQPVSKPLPVIDLGLRPQDENLAEQFGTYLAAGGGLLQRVPSMGYVKQTINEAKKSGSLILNLIPQAGGIDPVPGSLDVLNELQQVFMLGSVAVAENGAIWLPESRMLSRILPFITDQLLLVINEKQLVPTMHEAYDMIRTDEDGFGVFIAGPSKTADIEQSLVIGAHGARQLVVMMIGDEAV